MLTIGENMKKCRLAAGYSVTEFSELTGISEHSIRRYEADAVLPRLYNLIDLADVLQVSLDEYIGREVR